MYFLMSCTDICIAVVNMPTLLKKLRDNNKDWTINERKSKCKIRSCKCKLYEIVCVHNITKECLIFPICPNCSCNWYRKPEVINNYITTKLHKYEYKVII